MCVSQTRAAILVMTALLASSVVRGSECFTPPSWVPRVTTSPLDANANGIEDTLEALNPGDPANVIVRFNKCVEGSDLQRLQTYGTIGLKSSYLSLATLFGVPASRLHDLANEAFVAFVEQDHLLQITLDVSVPAIKIRTSTKYSPNTIDDAFPGTRGAGQVIAILDTGVDDGQHESLPAWKFVGGANCLAPFGFCNESNPDDDQGHGTHVAGIALGTGGDAGTFQGAAPDARLVDLKVCNSSGQCSTSSAISALDLILRRQATWHVSVINMSFGDCGQSDGNDSLSKMINRVSDEGIVVVVAAGNCSNCNMGANCVNIGAPAAADAAITVANMNDAATVDRADDGLNSGSCHGPRKSDGDGDTTDEEKPDVGAPGTVIRSAQFNTVNGYVDKSGTSMASPHVAGCVARLRQKNSLMTPEQIKRLLRRTATPNPANPTTWDPGWGDGYVDCWRAMEETTPLKTDLAFVGNCAPFPTPLQPPCWNDPALHAGKVPAVNGVPNTIETDVVNVGNLPSGQFYVRLGTAPFFNGLGWQTSCFIPVQNLNPGDPPLHVSCPWTPKLFWFFFSLPFGFDRLKAEIVYPEDTNPLGNTIESFGAVYWSHSPVRVAAAVVNRLETPQTMHLTPVLSCATRDGGCPDWSFSTSDNDFLMNPTDCARQLVLGLDPIGPAAPRRATAHVRVTALDPTGAPTEQDGIGFSATLGCLTRNLVFSAPAANHSTFSWSADPFYVNCPHVFDIARGGLPLASYPNSSAVDLSGAACLADDTTTQQFSDTTAPPAGTGFWYLVRAGGSPAGSWDEASGSGQNGTRDATLGACP